MPKKKGARSSRKIKKRTGRTKANQQSANLGKQRLAFIFDPLKWEAIITTIIFIGLVLVVLIGPLKRGFFYETEQISLHIFSFSLFLLWWVSKQLRRDASLVRTPFDLVVLLFLFAYLLSLTTALHPRPALGEFLKVANYAALYFIATDLFKRHNLFRLLRPAESVPAPELSDPYERGNLLSHPQTIMLFVLVLSGFGVAAGSLLNAAGIIYIPDAYFGGRITTSFGYANTGAAYLMSTYFIALGLGSVFKNWFLRPLFLAPLALMVITIVLTYSRGVWVVILFSMVLLFFLTAPGKRLLTAGYIFVTCAFSLPFVFTLNKAFSGNDSRQALTIYAIILLATLVGGYLVELILKLPYRGKVTLGGLATLLLVAVIIFLIIAPLGKQLQLALPEEISRGIYSRVTSVDLRFAHNRDALMIIRDYPLLGVGGGGWEALYRSYQETEYITRYVHNHFLEIWLDSGLLGFLSFTALWIIFIYLYYKSVIKQNRSIRHKQIWTAIFIAAVSLGAHSVIDWNLTYASLSIYLFMLFAMANSMDESDYSAFRSFFNRRSRSFSSLSVILVFFIAVFMTIYTSFLYFGLSSTLRSKELLSLERYKDAEIEINRGIRYDPLRADNYYNKAGLYEMQYYWGGGSQALPLLINMVEKAYHLEPYNPMYLVRYANLLLGQSKLEEGYVMFDRLIKLLPLESYSYLQYATSLVTISDSSLYNITTEEKRESLNRVLELERIMLEKTGSAEPLYYLIGKAHYLLGNRAEALSYLKKVKPDHEHHQEALLLIELID